MKKQLFLLCLLFLTLAGCNHKELCYQHPHTATLRVVFDWRNAPDASPEGMCIFFYPDDGGEVQRFDFSGTEGGTVNLPTGKYRAVCYNNDLSGIQQRGVSSFYTHEAYTREGNLFESIYGNARGETPRAEGTENERVVICPDPMWGCNAWELEVTELGVTYVCVPGEGKEALEVENTESIITLYPSALFCTYTYEIRNVVNLHRAELMCASLSGMSGSWLFGAETLGTECVTLPFEAVSDHTSCITGGFYTFGQSEENLKPHKLVLYVWMNSGKKFYYTFDVTGQVDGAPDKRRVHLLIDGLYLPDEEDEQNGTGFEVGIDDWMTEEEDISM